MHKAKLIIVCIHGAWLSWGLLSKVNSYFVFTLTPQITITTTTTVITTTKTTGTTTAVMFRAGVGVGEEERVMGAVCMLHIKHIHRYYKF